MNPASIIAKINKVAVKYGPFDTRVVCKRTLFESGGNSLIDRGVTQAIVDVALVPQPLIQKASLSASNSPPPATDRRKVLTGTDLLLPGEYQFFFTATQLSLADVITKYNTLVMKDTGGDEEHLQLLSYEVLVLNGTEIGTNALYESVSRGAASGLPVYTGPGNTLAPVGTVVHYTLSPIPDGVRTSFTATVAISANAIVVLNGLVMSNTVDYNVSGTTLTFVTAPSVDASLSFYQ